MLPAKTNTSLVTLKQKIDARLSYVDQQGITADEAQFFLSDFINDIEDILAEK